MRSCLNGCRVMFCSKALILNRMTKYFLHGLLRPSPANFLSGSAVFLP